MTNPASALRAALTAHQAAGGTVGPLWSGPCVLACYAKGLEDTAEMDYIEYADALGVTVEYVEGIAVGWDAAYVSDAEAGDLSDEPLDFLKGYGVGYQLSKEAQRLTLCPICEEAHDESEC